MLKPSCVRKQRVWKLPTFLLYRFVVTAAYLISFLPLFLSTWCINTDRTCLLWLRSYVYISILFFWVQNFYNLYITKSWSVAFNTAALSLRHISFHVIFFKTESLKATNLPALPFHSNGCLSDFLPSFIPFHMVYKYWQNLLALVEVCLHLNSFFFFWCKTFMLCLY